MKVVRFKVTKLYDFGLIKAMKPTLYRDKDMTLYIITIIYRAPELLFQLGDYTHSIDVLSVG